MADSFPRAFIPSAFSGPQDTRGRIPLLFQVLSPDNQELLPEAMFLHVNPTALSTNYAKIVERFPTRGGFVEQHFGDQLTDISCDVTSGAFIHVDGGLAVQKRRETIAYEKFHQLVDLFHNNGLIYDTRGNVQYRGRIRLIFEGGVYDGAFRTLNVNETATGPFQFTCDFSFRVEKEVRDLWFG